MPDYITSRGTKDIGLPFSDAVRAGDVLYLSGALGNQPGAMTLAAGGIAGETRQMMQNIARTLEQNGLSFDDVFKATVMLADMDEWRAFNAVYLEYFKPERLPARSAFGTSGLALGARVEMEVWAWAGEKP
ncbi:MAG TPA: RidA family protein [Rhizomicrobium sp.]|jgi:reactive intermediate/imine deaminase